MKMEQGSDITGPGLWLRSWNSPCGNREAPQCLSPAGEPWEFFILERRPGCSVE